MARRKSTPLRTALSRMFPTAVLRRVAVTTGFVRRYRRVDPIALFWVLTLTLEDAMAAAWPTCVVPMSE
jgi:hypothetical protein